MERILKAFVYSWQGMYAAFRFELAFRQEVVLLLLMIPLACYLSSDWLERVFLIGSWFLVMIAELLNSGLEIICDQMTKERCDWVKRVKDYGSAAVFLAIVFSAGIWAAILIPPFI